LETKDHSAQKMSSERVDIHNFAAGPSPLPTPVLHKAAEGLLNYNGTGMGVCELSHRGKEFKAIVEGAEGEYSFDTDSTIGSCFTADISSDISL
jgi:hypothetical protein